MTMPNTDEMQNEPIELITALSNSLEAREIFDELSSSQKKEIIRWVAQAKKPKTRKARAERCLMVLLESVGVLSPSGIVGRMSMAG